jgi:hypothetical protein
VAGATEVEATVQRVLQEGELMGSYFDKVYAVVCVNADGSKSRIGQFYTRKGDAVYKMKQQKWRNDIVEVLEFELVDGKIVATTNEYE